MNEREAISLLSRPWLVILAFSGYALAQVHLFLYKLRITPRASSSGERTIEKALNQPDAGEVHLVWVRYLAGACGDVGRALAGARRTLPNDPTIY